MIKQHEWHALHCFLSDSEGLERFLLEAVVPEMDRLQAEKLMERWFYIRYDEGGHHLRVRMGELPESEHGAVSDRLTDALSLYLPQPGTPSRQWPRMEHTNGSVVPVPYESEFRRYGGAYAMPVSEKLFGISSRLAVQILSKAGPGMPARLAVAADLMTACVAGQELEHEEAIRFFMSYANYWEQFLVKRNVPQLPADEQAQTRYVERYAAFRADLAAPNQPPRSIAMVWARAIRETVRTYRELGAGGLLQSPATGDTAHTEAEITEAIASVLASQTHMMNNRLGVAPSLEYKLARLLARSAIDALARERGKAA